MTHRVPAVLVDRARDRAWHVDHCPGCGRQHAHRAGRHDDDPMRRLGPVRAPCGAEYVLESRLRPQDRADA